MNRIYGIQPRDGWVLMVDSYDETDSFSRLWYEAHHPVHGVRLLDVSDFAFRMTQERFNWLVDNDFPPRPDAGPWSAEQIDQRIADASSS